MKKFTLLMATICIAVVANAQWTTGTGIVSTTNNVGIGTSSPQAKLHVMGGDIKATHATFSQIAVRLNAAGTEPAIIFQRWQGDVFDNSMISTFWDAGLSKYSLGIGMGRYNTAAELPATRFLTIRHNGGVGIGTDDTGTAKLAVNGTINATEVKVTTTVPGPDYVFEKDYDLPTLNDIESYINTNKHLPEVPSAKEMEENGLQLGEMNLLLLKKIEELTLYVIEQQKQIDALTKKSK